MRRPVTCPGDHARGAGGRASGVAFASHQPTGHDVTDEDAWRVIGRRIGRCVGPEYVSSGDPALLPKNPGHHAGRCRVGMRDRLGTAPGSHTKADRGTSVPGCHASFRGGGPLRPPGACAGPQCRRGLLAAWRSHHKILSRRHHVKHQSPVVQTFHHGIDADLFFSCPRCAPSRTPWGGCGPSLTRGGPTERRR
jgi:hypothetical protein